MAAVYRVVTLGFWVLGLITTLVVLAGRIIRPLRSILMDAIEMRSLLWLAGVFFLGAIATRAVERPKT